MKFRCQKCQTRYSISDKKVRNKILKITCPKCSTPILIKDPGGLGLAEHPVLPQRQSEKEPARPAVSKRPARNDAAALALEQISNPTPDKSGMPKLPLLPGKAEKSNVATLPKRKRDKGKAPGQSGVHALFQRSDSREEWFARHAGNSEGPMSLTRLQEQIRQRRYDRDTRVWNPSFAYEWRKISAVEHLASLCPPELPLKSGDIDDKRRSQSSQLKLINGGLAAVREESKAGALALSQQLHSSASRGVSASHKPVSAALDAPGVPQAHRPRINRNSERIRRHSVIAKLPRGSVASALPKQEPQLEHEPIPRIIDPLPELNWSHSHTTALAPQVVTARQQGEPTSTKLTVTVVVLSLLVCVTLALAWKIRSDRSKQPRAKVPTRKVVTIKEQSSPLLPKMRKPTPAPDPETLNVVPTPPPIELDRTVAPTPKPTPLATHKVKSRLATPKSRVGAIKKTSIRKPATKKPTTKAPTLLPEKKSPEKKPSSQLIPTGVQETNVALFRKSLKKEPAIVNTPHRTVTVGSRTLKVHKSRLVRKLHRCMRAATRMGIQGKFVIGFTIQTSGRVSGVSLPGKIASAGVKSCIRNIVSAFNFPQRTAAQTTRLIVVN